MAVVVNGTAYGYYLTRADDGKLETSAKFIVPIPFTNIVPNRTITVALLNQCGLSGKGPTAEQGLLDDLDGWVSYIDGVHGGFVCHLFTDNGLTPDCDTVLGDFTEAAWHLYLAQSVTSWAAAVILSPHNAGKLSGDLTFSSDP